MRSIKDRLYYELEIEEEVDTFDDDIALANFDDDIVIKNDYYNDKDLIDYYNDDDDYYNNY